MELPPQDSDTFRGVQTWPKISIVTPSYNQDAYLEETIRSVLLQGYPKLEYIIMDGGSTDNSVEIIEKYKPWLTYSVSEPDRGQMEALNKGFGKATGELFGWVNSDDYLMPGALFTVAQAYLSQEKPCAIVGKGRMLTVEGETIWEHIPETCDFNSIARWDKDIICQAACIFPADDFYTVGGVSEDYNLAFDFDLWLKLLKRVDFIKVEKLLACQRRHGQAKTSSMRGTMWAETRLVQIMHGQAASAIADMEAVFNTHQALKQKTEVLTRNPLGRFLGLIFNCFYHRVVRRTT